MPFPGNQIFPQKIQEISRPEHLGTSSSWSQLSTGIRDWLLPSLVSGRETFGNSQTLPEWKLIILILVLVKTFLTGPIIIWTVPNGKSTEWYFLKRFSGKSLEIRYYSRLSRAVLSSPVPSRLFPKFFPNFLKWQDQKTVVLYRYRLLSRLV